MRLYFLSSVINHTASSGEVHRMNRAGKEMFQALSEPGQEERHGPGCEQESILVTVN